MANLRLATATRNAMLDAIAALIDAGAAGGTIKIYDGAQPANADTAITSQQLLATLTFSATAAAAAANGTLTFNTITEDTSADLSGTATWARIADSDGNTVFDCDVGTSGATINLNTTEIAAGGPVRITGGTLTQPAG